jgi:hypothetical protein
MRSTSSIAALAALPVLGLLALAALAADDRDRPFGGPPPARSTEERPFGGPPPSQRSLGGGTKCRTTAGVCTLDKARQLGAPCTCPGATAKGKVE